MDMTFLINFFRHVFSADYRSTPLTVITL